MDLDEGLIQGRCRNVTFDRGQTYYQDGRIRRIDQFWRPLDDLEERYDHA